MAVLKNGVPQPNDWVRVADGEPLPETDKAIVSLERWQAERETLRQRNAAIGVSLKSDQSPLLLEGDIDRLSLVALEFPKFTDGRAFSQVAASRLIGSVAITPLGVVMKMDWWKRCRKR